MSVDFCDPCGCIQPMMNDQTYFQASLATLCNILEVLQGGGGAETNVNLAEVGGVAVTLASLGIHNEDSPSASGDAGVASLFRRNDVPTVLTDADGDYSFGSVDQYGYQLVRIADPTGLNLSVLPASNAVGITGSPGAPIGYAPIGTLITASGGTTTVANITGIGATARPGDAFLFRAGGSGANQNTWNIIKTVNTDSIEFYKPFPVATQSGVNGYLCRPQLIGATLANLANSGVPGLAVVLDHGYQIPNSSALIKRRDDAAGGIDAGVQMLGVTNPGLGGTFVNPTNDYCPVATNLNGCVYTHLWYDSSAGNNFSPVKLFNGVPTGTDAVMQVSFVRQDTPVSNGTSGNYSWAKVNDVNCLFSDPASKAAVCTSNGVNGNTITTAGVVILNLAVKKRILDFYSTVDRILQISIDGGTTWPFTIGDGSTTPQSRTINLGQNGVYALSNIQVRAVGSNATAGIIYAGLVS